MAPVIKGLKYQMSSRMILEICKQNDLHIVNRDVTRTQAVSQD